MPRAPTVTAAGSEDQAEKAAHVPRSAPDSASHTLVPTAGSPRVVLTAHLGKAAATSVGLGATDWAVAVMAGVDRMGVEEVGMAMVACSEE